MKKVSIVGGGPVGSLLSCYLGQKGFCADVYEARPDMRKVNIPAGKSINMACSDRGWKALAKVGLDEKIKQSSIPMKGRFIHLSSGKNIFQPYGKEGQAIYSISRGELNKILMTSAEQNKNVTFHFNKKCICIESGNNCITLKNSVSGEETKVESDLIFGTDGAFSVVRQELIKRGGFVHSQKFISHAYKELTMPPKEDGLFALEKNALHIWPRKDFMLIALPNPDRSFTCTLFLASEGKNSFAEIHNETEVLKFFVEYFPDALMLMPELAAEFFKNPTSPLCMINCEPWYYKDAICLLGDAAHAIVPFSGQGMMAGFEDVYTLDECIDRHTKARWNFDGDSIPANRKRDNAAGNDTKNIGVGWNAVFREFNQKRKPDTDAIATLTLRNFIEMRELVGENEFLWRKRLERKISELFPEKFVPLYSLVSFSLMPYSTALEKGNCQKELLTEIMLSGFRDEQKWSTAEFKNYLMSLFHKYPEALIKHTAE